MSSDGLIFQQKIDLPYTYTAGRAHRAFLRGLAQQVFVGSGAEGYVPARAYAPDGTRVEGLAEVDPRGVVLSTTVAHHLGDRVFALVRVGNSPTPFLHYLDEELPVGTEVEPVWEEGAEPGVLALRCFRRAS